jgi:hypothetical protein
MRWVRLTKRQTVACATLVVVGGALVVLWILTHHLDQRHGAMHLLIGAISMAGGGATLLGLDAFNRMKNKH